MPNKDFEPNYKDLRKQAQGILRGVQVDFKHFHSPIAAVEAKILSQYRPRVLGNGSWRRLVEDKGNLIEQLVRNKRVEELTPNSKEEEPTTQVVLVRTLTLEWRGKKKSISLSITEEQPEDGNSRVVDITARKLPIEKALLRA